MSPGNKFCPPNIIYVPGNFVLAQVKSLLGLGLSCCLSMFLFFYSLGLTRVRHDSSRHLRMDLFELAPFLKEKSYQKRKEKRDTFAQQDVVLPEAALPA
jgi:hypothetical protein